MFPYVCIATMPLFCEENWPKKLIHFATRIPPEKTLPSACCIYQDDRANISKTRNSIGKIKPKHKFVVALLIGYCSLQMFLPYSHFITKVSNNL